MPTPIELLTAAQQRLDSATAHLSEANANILSADNLIEEAKRGLEPTPPPTLYTLVVVSGSGTGQYPAGHVQPVVALPPGPGQVFNGWLGPVTASSNPSTSVIMPASGVQVEATYRVVDPIPPTPGQRITALKHLGSFKVPALIGPDVDTYAYASGALAFCGAHNSLFLGGFVNAHTLGEISIPAFGATAASMQRPVDPFGGKIGQINPTSPNQKNLGGALVDGLMLVVSAYDYYDASGTQQLSHFRRPLTLSSGPTTVVGPYRVGPLGAGFYSGYMSDVPPAWRVPFGGRAFTGNSCLGIISRTSYGPSTAAFDPAVMTPNAIELVGYPDAHQTLGKWDANPPGQYFGGSDQVTGIAMPKDFATVLFVGRHGTTFCYGATPTPCTDPTDNSKGVHGYPYRAVAWFFDANDLAAVAAGTKAPWDVKPYAMIDLPSIDRNKRIGGCAYDPATGRLYVSELMANGTLPVIHVYEAQ